MPREQPGPGSYLMKVNWAAAKETPESYPKNARAWKPGIYGRGGRALAPPGKADQSGSKMGPRATSTQSEQMLGRGNDLIQDGNSLFCCLT